MDKLEPIPGLALSLHDFTGDLNILVNRLKDVAERLSDEYTQLTLKQENGIIQIYGIRIIA